MFGHVLPSSLKLEFISSLKSLLGRTVLNNCLLFLFDADLDDGRSRNDHMFKMSNYGFLPVTYIQIIFTWITIFHSSMTASLYLVNKF